ncbi:MAG TPA: ATP-binding protein [Vicinamibacterales bacterium]|nr:ATP-binding protein [Vicinamibacterales bacterium]
MGWLAFGVGLCALYALIPSFVSLPVTGLLLFRLLALLVPPLAGIAVILRRRHDWVGCQWLFWATIALGLVTTVIGHVGWTLDGLLLGRHTSWLGWHSVFVMFGTAAPLLALLAQPHRGSREAASTTLAVDIAGIAVVTGYLYSYVTSAADLAGRADRSLALLVLSELQPFLVCTGMTAAAWVARGSPWGATYRRLALGLLVNFVALTLSNVGAWHGGYRPGWVYDFAWILPLAFYPWAAAGAPSSATSDESEAADCAPSRPWVIFSALALIPLMDFALRRAVPPDALGESRDLSTAVAVVSVLPLLLARLAAERAELRRADDRFRLLAAALEQADELILILRSDGRLVHANEAFCRALGYTSAELRAMDARALLAEAAPPGLYSSGASLDKGALRTMVVRRRRDGTTFPASCVIVPLRSSGGSVTHLVSVERDVTEELRLRRQLIHSERLSAVGQLVAGVAHELNNPLQAVVGFTEMLLDAEEDAGARRDLGQIRSEAMRAARIVRHLLAFVRRSPEARTCASINDLVRDTVALRRYELETANIEVEEHYTESLPPVWVSREEIQQVVLNLILNAEHAMRSQARGRLIVRTASIAGGVAVDIEDDGPGVPPDLAGRIFEPFFTTKDVGEGTGLGLSIALGIAHAHEGALELVPSARGARFRLTLPAAPPEIAQTAHPAVSAAHG